MKKPKLQTYSVQLQYDTGNQTKIGYPILAENPEQALEVVKHSLAMVAVNHPEEAWLRWVPTGDVTLCDWEGPQVTAERRLLS